MTKRRPGRTALRYAMPALIGALALGVVVACTGSAATGAGEAQSVAAAAPTQAASERAGTLPEAEAQAEDGAGSAADSAASAGGAGQLATLPVDGTKVIKTADLSVRLEVQPVPATDDAAADREANARVRSDAVAATAGSIRGIAATAGGFVAAADGGGSQMSITLRVPADQYDGVLDKIAGLGEVTGRTESSQDVTAQMVDVDSRVASMTASVARVRALLDQATSIADVISIESELATREAELESLQQQQAYLQGQVAMSTVTVTLSAVTLPAAGTVEPEPDNGFVAGLKAGWAGLLGLGTWLGGALGAFLPFLPLVAIAALVSWWVVRRLRRRRRTAPVQPTVQDAEREPAGVS
jgi:hypothetical protein